MSLENNVYFLASTTTASKKEQCLESKSFPVSQRPLYVCGPVRRRAIKDDVKD